MAGMTVKISALTKPMPILLIILLLLLNHRYRHLLQNRVGIGGHLTGTDRASAGGLCPHSGCDFRRHAPDHFRRQLGVDRQSESLRGGVLTERKTASLEA